MPQDGTKLAKKIGRIHWIVGGRIYREELIGGCVYLILCHRGFGRCITY